MTLTGLSLKFEGVMGTHKSHPPGTPKNVFSHYTHRYDLYENREIPRRRLSAPRYSISHTAGPLPLGCRSSLQQAHLHLL